MKINSLPRKKCQMSCWPHDLVEVSGSEVGVQVEVWSPWSAWLVYLCVSVFFKKKLFYFFSIFSAFPLFFQRVFRLLHIPSVNFYRKTEINYSCTITCVRKRVHLCFGFLFYNFYCLSIFLRFPFSTWRIIFLSTISLIHNERIIYINGDRVIIFLQKIIYHHHHGHG